MSAVTWTPQARDGAARSGWVDTPHGRIPTPAFMPVGTRAAVKAVDSHDLEGVGAEIVLANTYHLMLRPGSPRIAALGGLHGFMAWDRPILTDSGGFQIFSLEPVIEEHGARFRSVYDGSEVELTPEDAVRIQEELAPDIAMALDVCVGLPAPIELVEAELERTLRWGERCLRAHTKPDQALFGIVQGGIDPDLRAKSAAQTAALGFPGFGIGGLSVGEGRVERNLALESSFAELPEGKPRYVMGLGDTEGLLDAIGRGADMFDCVLPTRLARHGKVLTRTGDFSLRNAVSEADDRPIDDECACQTCRTHSRAYLRHLVRVKELSAHRLLTIHNLRYTLDLVAEARFAIESGTFSEFVAGVAETRFNGS
ncbi:MAG TPA: tRNA guanosine(34) transglycosylase Tgt, partial [Acidimicrobiia bacterium]|nr:tRNA guanosine(34) transglycosylase Tgt [Acidimicrobiia bacterium]